MYYEHNFADEKDLPVYSFRRTYRGLAGKEQWHWHKELELLACESGEAIVVCGTAELTIHAGETAMINPGELHTLYSPNGCVYYCLHIGKQILETLGTTRPLNVQTVDPMVISAISDILVELSCGDAYYRQNAVAKATQLVVYLYRNHAANSSETLLPNREIAVVKQILAYLEQNYVQRVYIADLCAHLNFSASYLSHVFKKFTGHSIVEHVNTLRCGRACELLRSSTYNIAQIAFMCGFRSSAYFCAIFRRECGVSPATYRVTNQMNL